MKKIITLLLCCYCSAGFAQTFKDVDFTEFVRDIQIWKKDNNRMQLVWWLPNEYWKVAFSQTNTVPPEVAGKVQDMIKDYVIICAGDMKFIKTELFFKTKNEILPVLSLTDSAGKKYYPLAAKDITEDAVMVEEILKPMFSKIIGQMGAGINIFYFKVKDKNGKNIIDPYAKELFTVNMGETAFTWQLPIVSLLPPKFCPVDKEKMKGNWNFCPVHGDKLTE